MTQDPITLYKLIVLYMLDRGESEVCSTKDREKEDNPNLRNHGDRFLILPAINEDLYPLII